MNMSRVLLGLFLCSGVVFASPPKWEIISKDSTLTFAGTQNGAAVQGSFSTFNGEIVFGPDDLQHSRIHIVVPLSSLQMSFADLKTTLLSADWFDSQKFPNAVYDAKTFEKSANGEYLAKGTLNLRDKTLPLVLTFKGQKNSADLGTVTGHAEIKRLDFGIGQGEWKSTDEIKDLVRVDFKVSARRVH